MKTRPFFIFIFILILISPAFADPPTTTGAAATLGGNNTFSGTNNFTGTLQVGGVSLSAAYAPAAGSSSITTLGTITTGTWHGTAISDSYISSASTWNAKQSALTFSTGLNNSSGTITVNAISLSTGGSGGVTGTLPIANGGTGATTAAAAATALGWSKNIVVLSAKVTCDASVDQTTDTGTDVGQEYRQYSRIRYTV